MSAANVSADFETAECMLYGMRDRLVKERKKSGTTQKELARYIGVSTVHMNRLEKGLTIPGWHTLYSWCYAMGYEPGIALRKTGDGRRV